LANDVASDIRLNVKAAAQREMQVWSDELNFGTTWRTAASFVL